MMEKARRQILGEKIKRKKNEKLWGTLLGCPRVFCHEIKQVLTQAYRASSFFMLSSNPSMVRGYMGNMEEILL